MTNLFLSLRPLTFLVIGVFISGCTQHVDPPPLIRPVKTVVLQADAAPSMHKEFAAEVRARVESNLGFRVSGKIVKRLVEVGQNVVAEQVLMELDPKDLKLTQDAARANLVTAQANFDQVKADFARYQQLRNQNFISEAELERHATMLKSAAATLDQARANVAVQVNQTAYAQLKADIAGIVTGIDAEVGQIVAAGIPVLKVAQNGPRDIVFSIPEDQGAWIQQLLGKPDAIKVKLWARDDVFTATLRELTKSVDPITRTFTAKATVANPHLTLGQTATVAIDLPDSKREGGLLSLPLGGLVDKNGQSCVWLLNNQTMTVSLRPVQVATLGTDNVFISSGLQAGQEIVTAGVHTLQPGQKVRRYQEHSVSVSSAGSESVSQAHDSREKVQQKLAP